ncbi:hypothetical protein LP421_32765 (plasmid) [Rhizobium sp. RCAM05350]|uniref:hypothetical protein n=1 Tax=Rhizobium sp. RCAM05350 TaxID=2895568 RepID=UPI002076A353|nr:hypothetical protein [Rhizobium sp. RCAM05350]URK89462.1 hypothetical protein LP421_32765 [Rhizobium sp. RCAM05350]
MKQELDTQLVKAAELGASGNGVIREAAEVDDELKNLFQTFERERQKAEREKPARSEPSEAGSNQQRDTPTGAAERDPEVQKHNEADERYADFEKRVGDTTRGDPAKQHVPRLEELQREADERNERERDDRER